MRIRRAEIALLLQAAAIVAPVAALSGLTLYFVRVERSTTENTARSYARKELPEFVAYLKRSMRQLAGSESAWIRDGQPVVKGDYPQAPEPATASTEAAVALQGLEAMETNGSPELAEPAIALAARYPGGVTESGAPVPDLALLLAIRNVRDTMPPRLAAAIRRNVTEFPSFLTPELVRAAGIPALTAEWERNEQGLERKRQIVRALAARLVGLSQPAFLRLPPVAALCDPTPDGWALHFAAMAPFPGLLDSTATVEIDGEHWRVGTGFPAPVELASETGTLDIPGGHRYRVTLEMSPETYNTIQRRGRLASALILCATATALIGLAALWRGYRRQMRLAEMQSNFVSSVSHELRAPLASVRLMAESLETGRVDGAAKRQDYYRLIVQECRRLSTLVENVLDLSRIHEGRKIYRFEPVDVAAMVRQSVALMEPCAAERRVSLQLAELPADLIEANWDGQAVEQALVNLLDNAIKHSPEGAAVEVNVERQDGLVRLAVTDRGPGIPAAEQKRIFEMFYRHGTELRRETKGAGIGLSIVQHVAEAHHGEVTVDSEVGRGSRFTLELPVERRV